MSQSCQIQFLGAAGTVTGSKSLVSHGEYQLMVDCGLFQGLKNLRQQNWQSLPINHQRLRAVLLTHAHLDHCGYLPRLVKEGFKGPIYCTAITAQIARIILLDSAKIQVEDARRANAGGYSVHHPAQPLYTPAEAENCLALFHPLEEGRWLELQAGLRFRFRGNGHIPGSAMIEMELEQRRLIFSGDVGRLEPLILQRPEALGPADLLVLESTYGNRLHSQEPVEEQLARAIQSALAKKGQILIPSFAVERSQEIIYLLLRLMQKGAIPRLPIYLDSPMAAAVTRVLSDYYPFFKDPDLKSLLQSQLEIISDYRASQAIVAMKETKIVIAGSGMITGGRILHHLEAHISKPTTTVILPGYQSPGTRGHHLQKGATEIKFFGHYHPVRAQVLTLQGLSAHADRDELLQWISEAESLPKRIILNHGEAEAADSLRLAISDRFGIPCQVAQERGVLDL